MKVLSAISLMSAPAAKALSEPVMTMQPICVVGIERIDRVAEFRQQRAVERVERLRAIEPDKPDPAAGFNKNVLISHGTSPGMRLVKLLLTRRTIERRAAALHDALDGAAATGCPARLALAIVDAEIMLKHAEIAVGEPMIAQ